ncbi:MAG: AI-2E family transporter [Bacteroidota bacterium]
MIPKATATPFYLKATIFLVGFIALVAILFIARSIVVPIVFSILIAILLNPIVNFLVKWKFNRVMAIVMALLVTLCVILGFGALIFSQASRFSESWPLLVDKFTEILSQATAWTSDYFDIKPKKIHEWILQTKSDLFDTSGAALSQTLITVGNGVVVLFLLPLYIFLLLYYKPLLLDFIHKLFAEIHQTKVTEIVIQIKTVIQRYLFGLVIEAALVAAMNSVALLLLGIQYAILLGIIGALLNVIPYIGGLVAVAMPMMIAIVTKSSAWYAIYVMAAYYFIQLVDNNYIVPIIVASKVRINALFSIIVVIAGNALWGIPGMFLSIPLLAIIKVIFDHIETLKPWGFLLGDTMPSILKISPLIKRKGNR